MCKISVTDNDFWYLPEVTDGNRCINRTLCDKEKLEVKTKMTAVNSVGVKSVTAETYVFKGKLFLSVTICYLSVTLMKHEVSGAYKNDRTFGNR